jgi:hypothetical protein
MIIVFTPVHGAFETAKKAFDRIDEIIPKPFTHYVGDDFSPSPDAELYRSTTGLIERDGEVVGERIVYHCRDLGCTESPNMGRSLLHMFNVARVHEAEALFVVESDVLPRPGVVDAFRQACFINGPPTGLVAPLYTEVGKNVISSFGGMSAGEERGEKNFLGLELGQDVGSWEQKYEPRLDKLWWTHLACTWIPLRTLQLKDEEGNYRINPDIDFELYYCDHDLSFQVRDANLDIIITDKAIAEHTRACASTRIKWPNEQERNLVELAAKKKVYEKWNIPWR